MVDLRTRAEMIEKAVNDFGAFLYDFRMKKSISLQQMADRVSITPSYLCRIENGKRMPELDVRIRILTKGMHWSVIDVMLYLDQVIGKELTNYQSN
jgi:transcriptional regulator with XRE-family HTH domain